MEGTKPDIIAQRLKDGYEINGDAMSVEASQLKYQLWLLAALQLGTKERPGSSCGTSSPSKSSRLLRFSSISSSSTITTAAAAAAATTTTGQEHIMVLFGSLADLYQIGIFHAHKQVTATSTFPIPQLALPPNVAYQLMSSPTYLPLPYPPPSLHMSTHPPWHLLSLLPRSPPFCKRCTGYYARMAPLRSASQMWSQNARV